MPQRWPSTLRAAPSRHRRRAEKRRPARGGPSIDADAQPANALRSITHAEWAMRVPRVRAIRPDRTGVPGVPVMVVRPLAVRDDRTGPGVVGIHPIARGIRLTGNVGIRRRRCIACARSIDAIRDHDARAGVVGPLVHDVDRRRRNRRRLDGRGGVAAAAAAATAAATASPADRRLGIGRQGRAAAAAAAGKDRLRIGLLAPRLDRSRRTHSIDRRAAPGCPIRNRQAPPTSCRQ